MLPNQDMAAEAGCHATQTGFLLKTVGKADGVLSMTKREDFAPYMVALGQSLFKGQLA
jgi:hypothetical protein